MVRGGLTRRIPVFLDMLERAVFAHPASPYRPLLEAAGYDLPRVTALVHARGLEGALAQLAADGVHVAIEEYKRRRPVRRGRLTLELPERAFANPLTSGGIEASSGGTRSPGLWTSISLENHRMGAQHLALALHAYGLGGAPVAVWLPYAHGASLWAVLALAATGHAPPRWFTQLPIHAAGARMYGRWRVVQAAALAHGVRLPAARHVPVGEESVVLDWALSLRGRPAGCFTTPSSALRLAREAARRGADLGHLAFITIGEPLTPAKLAAIQGVGARAHSSLGFTEYGRVTYGCAAPDGVDDGHVFGDAVAVGQRARPVDAAGTTVDALLFTALRADARTVLLNMETGDYADLARRRCGCPLDQLGLTLHLRDIRSFEKLNAEGRLFFGSDLIALVEEVLPARFGGDAGDYQLLEEEDAEGFTRLSVLVHPRLGDVDEEGLRACVERALARQSDVGARVWTETGTLRVQRAAPLLTGAGKVMTLHHRGRAPRAAVTRAAR
jgi:hypothetical protein